ncbi:MAG: gliding motility-associated ABC transporter ATP-binding subunit GldA [Bacteroidales bacterium]|nr:gliding motility-associated ABC transporter ATP-binding subunit GldA [Bacteroidales bacterium]
MSLKATNVTKIFDNQKALDSVNFEIKTGEVVGFLGPNGAGKSTMMKIITGYIKQNSGEVTVNGINTKDVVKNIKKQIGYLPEHNPMYLDMYIKEYLSFVAKIYEIGGNIKSKVKDIIEITGLQPEKNKKIGALSKGYRQRTGLAAALIHDPKVLILDEPTTGLDPNQIIEIRDLIKKIGTEKTVMLSTHIMQEVEAICSRVIIINNGKIIADNSVAGIQELSKQKHDIVTIEFNKPVSEESLKKITGVKNVTPIDKRSFLVESKPQFDVRENIFKYAVNNNLILFSMFKKEKSVEDVFRELTK